MSATRDKNQKVAFVYSNLYEIYRKGKDAAVSSPSHNVLKANDVNQTPFAKVRSYTPAELIGKRIQRPKSLPSANPALQSLKDNLKALNDLHARLRFMLQELEELVKS